MLMKADDIVTQKNLDNDFKCVCNWFEANELIINSKVGKIEKIVFGTA